MICNVSLILLVSFLAVAVSRSVLELQGVNFELALTSYKYAAILFYDSSTNGQNLIDQWLKAAEGFEDSSDIHDEGEIAMINGSDPEIKELIDAYSIQVPSIKVFRRGIMADYRGPFDIPGITNYLREDSQPSVRMVSTLSEMKQKLKKEREAKKTVVLGFFAKEDIVDDGADAYSIDPWGQFQAAADSLRGHAVFYSAVSADVLSSFKVKDEELPVVYMLSEDGEGLLQYQGEILEMNLSEWVLRNAAPTMGELTFAQPAGEIFATQFFSARKLKFILFLRASDVSGGALENWQQLADTFKGSALFAYMVDKAVPDVVDYFAVDVSTDSPMIVAHDPSQDFKYKSKRLRNPADATAQQEFVAGVLTGAVRKVLKSEPVPKQVGKVVKPVKQAVGSNVIALVSQVDKDVLLEVYSPNCAHCKRLRPTYDILGRAVQGDNRVVIAKIDGTANDIPASWGIKGYPALLWFPAKDKPYKEGKDGFPLPAPRPYWDAGHSLHELVSFVQRQSSFDFKSLKVATSEQLGTLMGDEDILRQQYELEDRWARRNEGRDLLENPIFDWVAGEVAFDGKRW
eukprot:CAMPEP_0119038502 /NCGR_PEP_ID=MMETSP1177-20130426/7464_1 /TAXON_ID=2985 /ORGANISM="Ochromonas sp, Strain CCMP1899" /LENGTH=571 /DNA_ID=CAMNT_0007001167 /DNA_START=151 /DNA_END=1863 /DNA_ORIENTATION=-